MGIFARHNSEWYRVDGEHGGPIGGGELPGLGGWATITEVEGKGTKHSYGDWVAFEWTDHGSVTTQAGGLVDVFLIGGGAGINSTNNTAGQGGRVLMGVENLSIAGKVDVTIGPGGAETGNFDSYHGRPTSVGNLITGLAALNSGSGATEYADQYAPIKSSITGKEQTYGTVLTNLRGGSTSGSSSGRGDAGHYNGPIKKGTSGCAIIRVPKSNYTGDLPDGAFDIPTTRQAIVEAVEEKVEEAKEAVRDRRSERRRRR